MFKIPKDKTRILKEGEGKKNLCPDCGKITSPLTLETNMFNNKYGYICEECHSIWYNKVKISMKTKLTRILSIIGR